MAKSAPALVKPELLTWARESAGLSREKAASLAKIHELTLEEWEVGHVVPTIVDLRKLGEIYKRPIAVFFLPSPPRRFDAQREFRRLAGIMPGKETSKLLLALRWAVFRREAAKEVYRLLGDKPPELASSLDPAVDVEEGGAEIRKLLGIDWETQIKWTSPYEALNTWRAAIEARGVLVFQTSDVALTEMRGTCIPDQPLPVILLNAKDAPHGRIFSLLHEFTHILYYAAGHRTSRMTGERLPEEQPLEVAANAMAAAALLPKEAFTKIAASYRNAPSGDNEGLKFFAQKVKVSPEVILRRLVTLNLASESTYRSKREMWGVKQWYVPAPSKGGPPMEIKTVAKDGRGYTRLVLDAYDQRLINTSNASDFLGVKPRHFPNIRRELSERGALVES